METQCFLVSITDSKDSKAQSWGGAAALLIRTHLRKTLDSVGSWGGSSFTTDKEQLCECKYLRKFDLDNFSPVIFILNVQSLCGSTLLPWELGGFPRSTLTDWEVISDL